VGKTVQNPKYRYSSHISVAKYRKKKDYTHCWIKSLLDKDLIPTMNIIEETTDIKRETFWISHYRKLFNLTNFTDGGDLGNLGKTWKVKDKENYKRYIKPVILFDLNKNKISEFDTIKECSIFVKGYYDGLRYALKHTNVYKNYIIFYKSDFSRKKLKDLKIKDYKFKYDSLSK
jgi:hypothetical protein